MSGQPRCTECGRIARIGPLCDDCSPGKEQTYWIFSEIEECMLCGLSHIHKVRMPMPKPDDIQKRWHYTQRWCGCDVS